MAEPVTLYKGNDAQTVYAPSEVQRMVAEGWTLAKPTPQPEPTPEPKQSPEPIAEKNQPAVRRGRKPKAK